MVTATPELESSVPKAWSPLRYHEQQQALWDCKARFIAVPAGRGSGKTELAKRKLVRELARPKPWDNPIYFYGGPTEGQAKRVAWRHILKLIPPEWVAEVNHSALRISTIFGSDLYVTGMDNPARIEGVQWDGCVLDESCDLKPGVFDLSVFPALMHRNGWCWRIGVPKRSGSGAPEFKKFYEGAITGQIPDSAAFTWPSSDILPPEVIAHARATLDVKDFREQFEACWETAGGAVFYAFSREYNVRPCEYHADRALVVGSDFNVDPMAWVFGHRYENRIEWIDELWLRDCNTEYALSVLFGKYGDHKGGFEFYGDASGQSRTTSASVSDYIHILNHAGFKQLGRTIHYPASNPAIADRVASCNAMFATADGQRRCFVAPNCVNLIRDLESRYYKTGKSVIDDKGDLGHITDAMGYAIHRLFPIKVKIDGPSEFWSAA